MYRKRLLLLANGFAFLLAGTAMAGPGFEACTKEEKRLRLTEADQCNGMSYIFNPSACFITRKELAPYDRGKCREAARQERIDPARPDAVTDVKIEQVMEKKPEQLMPASIPLPEPAHSAQVAPLSAAAPTSEIEQLRREVAELKAGLERLKEEVARMRGAK